MTRAGGTVRVRVATAWAPPTHDLTVAPDEVHVWRAPLDLCAAEIDALTALLAPDERARAKRFHHSRDRDRFIVARGILRWILARYLRTDPRRLTFGENEHGKPRLIDAGSDAIAFNLSHSEGLALYALARGREVGVDVERVRRDLGDDAIAELFFSPREAACLRALPPVIRPAAFFALWTRKEAYVKAHGDGLTSDLDAFTVSLDPGRSVVLAGDGVREWSIEPLVVGSGFAAAIAVEGARWRLACWQWSSQSLREERWR